MTTIGDQYAKSVLLVGASGRIGRSLAPLLANLPGVRLGLTSTQPDRIADLADSVGAKVTSLDVLDEDRCAAEFQNWDVVINTAGPEERVVLPVLRSCIRAGSNYGDIAANSVITARSLALASSAQQAGVSALIGAGTSPAVSCLLAQHAVAQLDTVDELIVGYIYPVPDPSECPSYARDFEDGRGSATWITELEAPVGQTEIVRNGGTTTVDAWSHTLPLTFPMGPTVEALPCNYPETTLLHHAHPTIPNISMVVQFDSTAAADAWRTASSDLASGASINDVGAAFFHTLSEEKHKDPDLTRVAKIPTVNVTGTLNGRKARYNVRTTEWVPTEVIAATACAWLIGQPSPGVHTAESTFAALPFLRQAYTIGRLDLPTQGVLTEELILE